MTIADVYRYALWVYNELLKVYNYFKGWITDVYNDIRARLDKLGQYLEKKILEAVNNILQWVEKQIASVLKALYAEANKLLNYINGVADKIYAYLAKQINAAIAAAYAYANKILDLAEKYALQKFVEAWAYATAIAQIAKAWGFDFSALGEYLGYLGGRFTRPRIDRLVLYADKYLDRVMALIENPTAPFLNLLKVWLWPVLEWVLADALKSDKDKVPPFPYGNVKG